MCHSICHSIFYYVHILCTPSIFQIFLQCCFHDNVFCPKERDIIFIKFFLLYVKKQYKKCYVEPIFRCYMEQLVLQKFMSILSKASYSRSKHDKKARTHISYIASTQSKLNNFPFNMQIGTLALNVFSSSIIAECFGKLFSVSSSMKMDIKTYILRLL